MTAEWLEFMSWVAAGCTCLSLYWLAAKGRLTRINGWAMGALGAGWWGVYSIYTGQWALLLVNVAIFALAIRGLSREL